VGNMRMQGKLRELSTATAPRLDCSSSHQLSVSHRPRSCVASKQSGSIHKLRKLLLFSVELLVQVKIYVLSEGHGGV
jgi:hypothetical protein